MKSTVEYQSLRSTGSCDLDLQFDVTRSANEVRKGQAEELHEVYCKISMLDLESKFVAFSLF